MFSGQAHAVGAPADGLLSIVRPCRMPEPRSHLIPAPVEAERNESVFQSVVHGCALTMAARARSYASQYSVAQ